MLRWLPALCCISLTITSTLACASHGGPAMNPNRTPHAIGTATAPIALPCALTPVARQLDPEGAFPMVFVELAAVSLAKGSPTPNIGQRPAGFLNTSDVRVLRVGNLTTKVGVPVTTAWDDEPTRTGSDGGGECNNLARFDLTLTLHEIDLQKRQLKLEIAIAPAPPLGTPKDAWYVPEHRQMHTTAIVGDQQPIMLGGEMVSHRETPSILVATPYTLLAPEHLNELLQCRLDAMSKAKLQRTDPPRQ